MFLFQLLANLDIPFVIMVHGDKFKVIIYAIIDNMQVWILSIIMANNNSIYYCLGSKAEFHTQVVIIIGNKRWSQCLKRNITQVVFHSHETFQMGEGDAITFIGLHASVHSDTFQEMLVVCFIVFDKGFLLRCNALKSILHLPRRYVFFFHRQISVIRMDSNTDFIQGCVNGEGYLALAGSPAGLGIPKGYRNTYFGTELYH